MISFYPGPSRVYSDIPTYVADAYREGLLSANHRSPAFMSLMEKTVALVKKKLAIPNKYEVYFTSSATECWQIIAQAYEGPSHHVFNGSFGKKWFTYTQRLKASTSGLNYPPEQKIDPSSFGPMASDGLICLTNNETSNGTMISDKSILKVKNAYPNHLIAVDATSSMAGTAIDFTSADIWFASVQKCFGLPAGMAVMVCSPRAVQLALDQGSYTHYNSLANIIVNAHKSQTTHTPNVLNIYLLRRTMEHRKHIVSIDNKLAMRYEAYEHALRAKHGVSFFIDNPAVRSKTVLVVKGDEKRIGQIKKQAHERGIILGNGYGTLKDATFRIANFPAIKKHEHHMLLKFLNDYIP